MMYKKILIALSSLVLLSACDTEDSEPNDIDTTEETTSEADETANEEEGDLAGDLTSEDENEQNDEVQEEDVGSDSSGEEVTETPTHAYDNLIDEITFTNEEGLAAWDDYKALIDGFSLGEVTIMNEEDPDYTSIDGATRSDLEDRAENIDMQENVYQEETPVSDFEQLVFHRYPPAEDSEYTEMADFFAEITFYYVEDTLMFSAITPGLYSVELDNLPDAEKLMNVLTLSEIEEIDPKLFTVAQMTINGNTIDQMMTPALAVDEEGNEQIMAFYLFTHGEDVLQYAYLPFEMVSQDFPTNSVILYQQVMSELENL